MFALEQYFFGEGGLDKVSLCADSGWLALQSLFIRPAHVASVVAILGPSVLPPQRRKWLWFPGQGTLGQ